MVGRLPLVFCVLTALTFTAASALAAGDFDPNDCTAPLSGKLALLRFPEWGFFKSYFAVVELEDERLYSFEVFPNVELIPNIEQIAVSGNSVFGKSGKGFFILDASEKNPHPLDDSQFFKSEAEWRLALARAGVTDFALVNPESWVAKFPESVKRPWNYDVMHNRFGMSDDGWSLVVQAIGLLAASVLGWRNRNTLILAVSMIILSLVVDFLAQVILGDGPGATVGMFAYPIIYFIVALICKAIRYVVAPPRTKRTYS